jgi:hypothetical protein
MGTIELINSVTSLLPVASNHRTLLLNRYPLTYTLQGKLTYVSCPPCRHVRTCSTASDHARRVFSACQQPTHHFTSLHSSHRSNQLCQSSLERKPRTNRIANLVYFLETKLPNPSRPNSIPKPKQKKEPTIVFRSTSRPRYLASWNPIIIIIVSVHRRKAVPLWTRTQPTHPSHHPLSGAGTAIGEPNTPTIPPLPLPLPLLPPPEETHS